MYTDFFGLREKPFELSPDPRYLFLSTAHREVLGHLIYGIEQREGFIAITGEVGTGKTTLCRTLLERLGSASEVAFLFNPHVSPVDLLKAINAEFGLSTFGDSAPELIEALNNFLLDKKAEDRNVLVIVDEAQTLSTETLEQLRLLSNLETSTTKLLQIVLLGQPELDDKLESRELRQLRQRIAVHWHLGPLTSGETRDYVRHRLRIAAGRECPIFTDGALATVYRVSGGVPRLINLLCERALLAAYADNARQVNRALVRVVAKEVWPPRRPRTRRALRRASWAALAVVITALGFAAGLHLGTTTETGEARASAGRGATPPAVASAPPRVSAPPSPAMPPTTAEPSATTDDTSAAGDRRVLDDLLPLNTSDRANAAALTAALDAWRMPAAQVAPFEVDALPDALAAHDLRMLRVPESDFDALQRLDLPAIVWLSAAASEPRAVLVRRIERDTAFLRGVLPGETVRIHLDELLERWTGDAIVPWRDYAGLPDLVAFGDSGPHVTWLQEVLTRTGYFVGLPRGGFDEGTRMAVRAFQLASEIPADGQVGPLTKIRIYQTLGEHAAPALLADSDPSG